MPFREVTDSKSPHNKSKFVILIIKQITKYTTFVLNQNRVDLKALFKNVDHFYVKVVLYNSRRK